MRFRRVLSWLARPRNLWLTVFVGTILAGAFVQLLLLPVLFPAWHAGNGLIKGVDEPAFHRAALQLAQDIQLHGWSAWQPEPRGQFVSGIAAIFYVLIYPAPWSVLPLNAALNASACVCLYLMLARLIPDRRRALVASFPFILFPSNLLWNTQFHNENYAVPGVILILLGWTITVIWEPRRSARGLVEAALALAAVLIGSVLLGLVRLYILAGLAYLFVLVGMALMAIWLVQRLALGRYLARSLFVLAACALMLLTVQALGSRTAHTASARDSSTVKQSHEASAKAPKWRVSSWLPSIIDGQLAEIALSRRQLLRQGADAGSNIDVDVAFGNATDIIAYVPRALEIALLAPFPNFWFTASAKEAGTAMRLVSSFEMILVYAALLGLPIYMWVNRRQTAAWVILVVCLGMLTTYALSVPNVGALYRFRYPFLMPLVCLGLAGWIGLWRRGTALTPAAQAP